MITQFKKHFYQWLALATFLAIAQTAVALANTKIAQASILWDIGRSGFFDGTNKAYAIEDGRVTVDLRQHSALCPTGLGHLANGRSPVREVEFRYEVDRPSDYWLHVTWNPGGSGKEQFDVLCNGQNAGKSELRDGSAEPYIDKGTVFPIKHITGENVLTLRFLSGDGLHFSRITLAKTKEIPFIPTLKPKLKFPTLESFENEIGEPGVLLDSTYVCMFTPKRKEKAARTVFPYLVKAYDELYNIVGVHTKYKMVIYNFPAGNPHGWGGTSECTIEYDDRNLELAKSEEWTQYGVPHISGYIEEMAHNFVHATNAQFGWEMIGWSIGTKITRKIADNPIYRRHVKVTRDKQAETFKRYCKLGYVFPKDIPANLCDRVHAYILWRCERKYGPNFWLDFFQKIHKERARLISAASKMDPDQIRNERYQITIECFDQLPRLDFKNMLERLQISLNTDIKSLHPTELGWNRKFIPALEE